MKARPPRGGAALSRCAAAMLSFVALSYPALGWAQADAGPPAEPPEEEEAPPEAAEPPEEAPETGEVIVVEGKPPAEAASSVHFTEADLRTRPHNQPSDLLRQTPGLVVAQHAGGGKADQYFLRGFDSDHGTDVAVFVDGVPVNLTSHGHGQGYADSHWIIPETIATLDVHKGPYAARYGDFYTAGALELKTLDEVKGLETSATIGTELAGPERFERPTYRLVGMGSPALDTGSALLVAELGVTDGPFIDQQDFRRGAALGKLVSPWGPGEVRLGFNYYQARWNQSGQIPSNEVDAGRLDRFGSLDPTEGGASSRGSVSGGYEAADDHGGRWNLMAYAVSYRLRLYSNFTLYARDQENGDQIEQTDARLLYGINGRYSRVHDRGGMNGLFTLGVQTRADDAEVALWHTSKRLRLAECFDGARNPCNLTDDRVRNLAAYAEEDLTVLPWLELIAGLRADQFVWDVEDLDPETALTPETTGGSAQRAILSPKLSVIARASDEVSVFVNGGLGFHSNDARAAVASHGTGSLARAAGTEVGARYESERGIRGAIAAWYLHLTSEQVWSGDNGGTEASDATRRLGLDLDGAWDVTPWLTVDANLALARTTLVENRGNGGALALAPKVMGGGGATVHRGRDFAAVRARGIGDRPANDDGSLTADGYLVLDLVAGWTHGPVELGLTVNNLLNAKWREAQFAEESRVTPTSEVLEDVHFTPGMPMTVLVTATHTL